jgi:hypothetical protein
MINATKISTIVSSISGTFASGSLMILSLHKVASAGGGKMPEGWLIVRAAS